MRTFLAIFPLALILGCADDKTGGSQSQGDSGGQSQADCDVTISATIPEDGTTDHYYLDPIRFVLSEPDGSATVITDIPGTTTTDAGGRAVVFTPDAPLAPNTSYAVALDYCHGTPEIGFSTSSYGAPVDPDVELEGRVFALDMTSGDFIIGESAGELLNAIFTRHVMFQLEELEGDELAVLVAVSTPPDAPLIQDECARTVRLEGLDASAVPYFSLDVSELVFGAHDGELRFTKLEVDGTISPDGSRIGGIAFRATMAVDEISRVLPDVGGVEALCQMAENLGIPCETCPSDGFALCITVEAEHILATGEDTSLSEILEAGQAEDCE